MWIRSAIVSLTNSSFERNHASKSGGAVYVEHYSVVNINHVRCLSNEAKKGGVLVVKTNTTVYAVDFEMDENFASYCGAVMVDQGSLLEIHRNNITRNNGTGVLCIYDKSVLTATNSSFIENKGIAVGFMAITNSTSYLNDCTFKRNHGNAAAIITMTAAELRISHSSFADKASEIAVVDPSSENRADDITNWIYTYKCHFQINGKVLKSDESGFQHVAMDTNVLRNLSLNNRASLFLKETQYASSKSFFSLFFNK